MSRGIMILLVAVILILAVVLALVLLRYKKWRNLPTEP